MPCERKPDPVKECVTCGKRLVRKRYPGGLLETYGRWLVRVSCGPTCQPRPRPERHAVALTLARPVATSTVTVDGWDDLADDDMWAFTESDLPTH